MNQVQVDVNQCLAARFLVNKMLLPDLVEHGQGLRGYHLEVFRSLSVALFVGVGIRERNNRWWKLACIDEWQFSLAQDPIRDFEGFLDSGQRVSTAANVRGFRGVAVFERESSIAENRTKLNSTHS